MQTSVVKKGVAVSVCWTLDGDWGAWHIAFWLAACLGGLAACLGGLAACLGGLAACLGGLAACLGGLVGLGLVGWWGWASFSGLYALPSVIHL